MKRIGWVVAVIASGCAGPGAQTVAAPASALVQNDTGDPELTALASSALREQLLANGISTRRFDLNAKLEAQPGGGLQLEILCSGRADHLLRAHVEVKGHGAAPRRLIPSMASQAARELAVDCR